MGMRIMKPWLSSRAVLTLLSWKEERLFPSEFKLFLFPNFSFNHGYDKEELGVCV